jgi:hypothetical protein
MLVKVACSGVYVWTSFALSQWQNQEACVQDVLSFLVYDCMNNVVRTLLLYVVGSDL